MVNFENKIFQFFQEIVYENAIFVIFFIIFFLIHLRIKNYFFIKKKLKFI